MIAATYTAPGVNAALIEVGKLMRKARHWRKLHDSDYARRVGPRFRMTCLRFAMNYEAMARSVLEGLAP